MHQRMRYTADRKLTSLRNRRQVIKLQPLKARLLVRLKKSTNVSYITKIQRFQSLPGACSTASASYFQHMAETQLKKGQFLANVKKKICFDTQLQYSSRWQRVYTSTQLQPTASQGPSSLTRTHMCTQSLERPPIFW